jgi:hypothetical protein
MTLDLESKAGEFDKLSLDEQRRVLRERSEIVHEEFLEFIDKLYGAYEATKRNALWLGRYEI